MLSRRTILGLPLIPILPGQDKPAMFSDAEAYERFMGRWSHRLADEFVAFAGLPDSGRVLDVGSGTGALAFAIASRHRHCEVLGIDIAKEYVAYAGSKTPFPERTKFQIGDAQHLEFPDGTFNHSLSLLVFNFIPDNRLALREVIRVTKPGGLVAAVVWDYGSGMQMLRTFWDCVVAADPAAEKLDEARMPLCRAGELEALWKEGGLSQVRERPIQIAMRFASFADYWEPFLLRQGPAGAYVQKLDETHRADLRDRVKRRLAPRSESLPFGLTARAWAVRGVVKPR